MQTGNIYWQLTSFEYINAGLFDNWMSFEICFIFTPRLLGPTWGNGFFQERLNLGWPYQSDPLMISLCQYLASYVVELTKVANEQKAGFPCEREIIHCTGRYMFLHIFTFARWEGTGFKDMCFFWCLQQASFGNDAGNDMNLTFIGYFVAIGLKPPSRKKDGEMHRYICQTSRPWYGDIPSWFVSHRWFGIQMDTAKYARWDMTSI